MFVSQSMTHNVVTIEKTAGIFEAYELMAQKQIRHLPVVEEDNHLIGVVTDRDIRSAMPFDLLKKGLDDEKLEPIKSITVADIMTESPMTVSPADTIQDALLMLQQKRVGAFPVADPKGKLVGMLSVRDLLRAFTEVLGIGQPGTLLCIVMEEKIGQLKKIVDAITEENISFGSVLVAHHWEPNKRAVFPYLLTLSIGPIKRKLKEMGFTLLDPLEWTLDQPDQAD